MPRLVASLLALAACAPLYAAAPPPGPLPSQVAAWIRQLGDDDPDVRGRAVLRLRAAGERAEDAVERATRHDDAEIRRQARTLAADFRRGIYLDTPDDVVELINAFATAEDKRPAVRKLIAAGRHGCRAVVKFARYEKDEAARRTIVAAVSSELPSAVAALADAGHLDALGGLVELALLGDDKSGVPHFAAFHLLNGTLPAQVERFTLRTKAADATRRDFETLAYLHRATGAYDKALVAARKAKRDDLVASLLYESGDWKALNAEPKLLDDNERPTRLGYRAAFARLAGDEPTFLAAIKAMLALADDVEKSKGDLHPLAKALWLNGRTGDALGLFQKRQTAIKLQYEIHAARLRFADAATVADDAVKHRYADHEAIEIAHARTLHLLGEKDKAKRILERYAALVKPDLKADWPPALVEVELAIGRRAEAYSVAAKIVEARNDGVSSARVFDKLFDDRAVEAASLWTLLRRPPGALKHAEALTKVRALLDGDAAKVDVEKLVAGAKNAPSDAREEQESAHWLAAGDAAFRHHHETIAAECFAKARSVAGTLRLGDVEASNRRWLRASVLYREAFRLALRELSLDKVAFGSTRERDAALALYLHGHALVRAGFAREGERRMEQGHLLPLGDADVRRHFMDALAKRGHDDAARREQVLLMRVCEAMLVEPHAPTAEGFRAAGLALADKEPLKAADEFAKSFLRVLQPDLSFGRNVAYVTVPALLLRTRAVGLAKAGKYAESSHEAKRCLAVSPGDVDLARLLVPVLDAKGRKKDADAVYAATKADYAALVKKHPKSAFAHNQLAWLAATCKRDLADGIVHARRATALEPANAGYFDTLAEVLFQSGKKDDAIAAQKTAIKLAPKRAEFARQLKRIEAGDPTAARAEGRE